MDDCDYCDDFDSAAADDDDRDYSNDNYVLLPPFPTTFPNSANAASSRDDDHDDVVMITMMVILIMNMDDVCEDFNANYTLLPLTPNLTPTTPPTPYHNSSLISPDRKLPLLHHDNFCS